MTPRTGARLLVAAAVWLVVLGTLAVGYRYGLAPYLERRSEVRRLTTEYTTLLQEAAKRQVRAEPMPAGSDPAVLAALVDDLKLRLTGAAGSTSATPFRVAIAMDSFSGYAVLRSEVFKKRLANEGVQVEFVDDGADYAKRLRSVATGQTPLAVFTIDALIKASADAGSSPATIVLVIDESVGADAMIAYSKSFPNLDALNRSDIKFVTVRFAPSETLARVVLGSFNLDKVASDPFSPAKSAEEVYQRIARASPDQPSVYVLWEPYVSKALQVPGTHVLIDSSRFRGYIVDVLVVQREYLLEHEDRVRVIVENYLRSAHELARAPGGMAAVVRADAAAQNEPLTAEQAGKLAKGIWWKNTTENYGDFGIVKERSEPGRETRTLAHMINNITHVLRSTGAIQRDPTDGEAGKFFYDRVARSLFESGFHPSLGTATGTETSSPTPELPTLSPDQWDALIPVGTLQVERIVFARGTSDLTEQSRQALTRLAATLQSFPTYYVLVRGQARSDGDPEANKKLAQQRAAGAAEFLLQAGIPAARIRAVSIPPAGAGGESQSVTFVLGQLPY
ncbi:MAG: phosphate ABC transporter substrate-binding/OmpA family protein [Phycisphaerales bacterium]